ncbi:hypothetical protein OVN18_07670 [Microcella daejeonensis]|uniref:DUF2946 domain-containing protein n=1 Tax=Microcella daejeonensis TaxID=2994971 RepID=A0A9E8S7S7_9MICO|nr:hypothetical protein [Microcella daejeonensis]WAB80453.1 hypothetical protein OVN18_07670 [Microcella daejeonensis]
MVMRLAHLLLIAALAIVGISMSAHSATPGGHSATASSAATVHALDESHEHSPAAGVAPSPDSQEAPCADCAEDHSGLLMACAFLALLLVVSFAFPLAAIRFGLTPPHAAPMVEPTRGTVIARPPDLAELCISRQ